MDATLGVRISTAPGCSSNDTNSLAVGRRLWGGGLPCVPASLLVGWLSLGGLPPPPQTGSTVPRPTHPLCVVGGGRSRKALQDHGWAWSELMRALGRPGVLRVFLQETYPESSGLLTHVAPWEHNVQSSNPDLAGQDVAHRWCRQGSHPGHSKTLLILLSCAQGSPSVKQARAPLEVLGRSARWGGYAPRAHHQHTW